MKQRRATAVLVRLTVVISAVSTMAAAAEPRVYGNISETDVRAIVATIRSTTRDKIVSVRASSAPDAAGVRTQSGATAGCQYFVRRIAGQWIIGGKSCWTHVSKWPPAPRSKDAPPDIYGAISKEDVREIIAAIRVVSSKPITFIDSRVYNPRWPHEPRNDIAHVSMGSEDKVTGDSYTIEKKDGRWRITDRGRWIH